MRAVVQRVSSASVSVDGEIVGEIGHGLLVLLGITTDDTEKDVVYLADKIVNLRILEDDAGKMNRSVLDVAGGVLVVSQFTLYGDCRQGRRPSFIAAARPEQAEPLYRSFVAEVKGLGVKQVATGQFQATMAVSLINDGPVTLLVESRKA